MGGQEFYYYCTKAELEEWKRLGVLGADTKFGDKVYGAILTEVKRLKMR